MPQKKEKKGQNVDTMRIYLLFPRIYLLFLLYFVFIRKNDNIDKYINIFP